MVITAQKSTSSRGLLLRDAVMDLVQNNRTIDIGLKQLNISNVVKHSPDDVKSPILYVTMAGKPVSKPNTLGRINVSYLDIYIIHLTYIHSRIDRDVSDQLIMAMDILTEFFESQGSINGLCTMGSEVHDAKITNYMDDKFIYNAVSMNLILPVNRKRDRNH